MGLFVAVRKVYDIKISKNAITVSESSLHKQVICLSNDITYILIKNLKNCYLAVNLKKKCFAIFFGTKISSTRVYFEVSNLAHI